MGNSKIWLVTGASQGLGLTLVKKLLESGYRIAATSRNSDALKKAVDFCDTQRFLPLTVDLNSSISIEKAVNEVLHAFGRIDVVVNNAGYGMSGTIEETAQQDVRNIFDINVFATMGIVQAVLPHMRRQKSGYIINIGSVAGFVGAPGWSVYSATKAAVAAFSEVLALDVKEFGIKVTVVEPSNFRTGFLTKESLMLTESIIEGYRAVKETQKRYLAGDGHQPGDPEKAAEIFIKLTETESPPLHLYLGRDAYNRASGKLAAMTEEIQAWKNTAISADFS